MELCELTYPVVVHSQDDEPIARINPDGTWSVKWSKVIDQAYAPLTSTNRTLCAICKVLLAARDNFRTSGWDDSYQYWGYNQFDIKNYLPIDDNVFTLVGPARIVAKVNLDGSWSVNWDEVAIVRTISFQYWALIPMSGFCELLNAAKDNFITTPMGT